MSKCNCGSNSLERKNEPEDEGKDKEEKGMLDNIHYILIAGIILLLLLIKSKC
tara:strand:- start:807 stop:965 length:159 start_codon:yes stop_codon:yes gene_type:complete